jgi:hypothetical protein
MKKFSEFLNEASIRQGLPHITTMDHHQFHALTADHHVHIHGATEKTDGSTHVFGHDHHGFYTQSSGSGDERMRSKHDYVERATRRSKETGKSLDLTAAHAFGHAHEILQNNKPLQAHLKKRAAESGGETKVRGELLHRPLSRPSEHHGEVRFVGTSYHTGHMGNTGKIIIHSKLPENQGHDIEHFKKHLSDKHINFDDDKIKHKPVSVNVSKHVKAFHALNHDLLNSRTTPSNKAAKTAELEKFHHIKKAVSDHVDSHVKKLGVSPKWGSETEGMVVHPKPGHSAPRFKVTSDNFRAYKADPSNKEKFKKKS